jgi:hypothetical protein
VFVWTFNRHALTFPPDRPTLVTDLRDYKLAAYFPSAPTGWAHVPVSGPFKSSEEPTFRPQMFHCKLLLSISADQCVLKSVLPPLASYQLTDKARSSVSTSPARSNGPPCSSHTELLAGTRAENRPSAVTQLLYQP